MLLGGSTVKVVYNSNICLKTGPNRQSKKWIYKIWVSAQFYDELDWYVGTGMPLVFCFWLHSKNGVENPKNDRTRWEFKKLIIFKEYFHIQTAQTTQVLCLDVYSAFKLYSCIVSLLCNPKQVPLKTALKTLKKTSKPNSKILLQDSI